MPDSDVLLLGFSWTSALFDFFRKVCDHQLKTPRLLARFQFSWRLRFSKRQRVGRTEIILNLIFESCVCVWRKKSKLCESLWSLTEFQRWMDRQVDSPETQVQVLPLLPLKQSHFSLGSQTTPAKRYVHLHETYIAISLSKMHHPKALSAVIGETFGKLRSLTWTFALVVVGLTGFEKQTSIQQTHVQKLSKAGLLRKWSSWCCSQARAHVIEVLCK